jgi:aspartate carbamoyltransferase regulatory subunit
MEQDQGKTTVWDEEEVQDMLMVDCEDYTINYISGYINSLKETIKRVEKENERLQCEWEQCHEANAELLKERYTLIRKLQETGYELF